LFNFRKFSGQTSLDLARSKPELASLVERFTSFNAKTKPTMIAEINGGVLTDGSGRARAASVRSISSELFEGMDYTRKISQVSLGPMSPNSPLGKGTNNLSPQFEHVRTQQFTL